MSSAKERLAAKRAARDGRVPDDDFVTEQEEVVVESAPAVASVQQSVSGSVESKDMTDTNSMLWFLFGLFFPIFALIIWIFNHKMSPRSCARAAKGAIVGICISIVLFFLGMMLAVSLMSMLPSYYPSELTPVSVSQESVYTYDEVDTDDDEDVTSSSSQSSVASSAYPGLSKKSSSSARDVAVDDMVDESEDSGDDTEEQTSSRYGLKHNQA